MTAGRIVNALALLSCGYFGHSVWMHGHPPSQNVELRDETGRLRCVLGNLGAEGYGLRLLGEGDELIELGTQKGRVFLGVMTTREVRARLDATDDGWDARLTAGGSEVRFHLGQDGMRCAHLVEKIGLMAGLASNPAQAVNLELRQGETDGKSMGAALTVDRNGSILRLLRDGKPEVQLAAAVEGVVQFLLGAKDRGIYAHTNPLGETLIQLSRTIPRLNLQSTDGGTGLAIIRGDGSPALQLGITQAGEVLRDLWTSTGERVNWDGEGKGKSDRKDEGRK